MTAAFSMNQRNEFSNPNQTKTGRCSGVPLIESGFNFACPHRRRQIICKLDSEFLTLKTTLTLTQPQQEPQWI
jgi:hypothetical protein